MADPAPRATAPVPDEWHPNRLLTTDEFCAWATISKRTFRQWCLEGTAPRRIRVGGQQRVLFRDAITWAEARYVA